MKNVGNMSLLYDDFTSEGQCMGVYW